MKFFKLFLIIFFLIFFIETKADVNNSLLVQKITKNIRCLICQGQSVYDSDSEFAISIKKLVNNKINQGYSEIEIYSFLKDKYGQWIVYEPEFNKNTLILWFLPILLFLVGGAIIFKKLILKKF
jgi:cytochrome c-type biogenesis protein CcmH|tara:strand:+ start:389 stop:760 length:372 start_codon:yes stop_codon:yes gene_type:complete